MINIVNIKDYKEEKEFRVAIPNKILLGFEYDNLNREDMLKSKIVHLYYSLVLLTSMGINKLYYMYLSTICSVTKIKSTDGTLKSVKKRLSFLENQGLIKIYADLENLKKNIEVNRKFKCNKFEVTIPIKQTKSKEIIKEEVKAVHMKHRKEIEIPF